MQAPMPLQDYRRVEEGEREPSAYDWTAAAWRALAVALGVILLVAIGALVASSLGAANSDKALDKLHKLLRPDECKGEVSIEQGATTLNVISRREFGGNVPPDTHVAVGNDDDGGRIITVVNRAVTILNKATHTRISNTANFYGTGLTGGDPWVTWDVTSKRFFLTAFNTVACRLGLTGFAPPAVVGTPCVGDATFGPQTFNLNGLTQVGSPLNACSAMAPLTGKIAVVIRGVCTFAVKVKNAQNAGAVGVVVYNNAGEAFGMSGVDATIVIPSVSVSTTYGTLLVTNSPANITIVSGGASITSTTMFISVSNTSTPNTRADFAHYAVTDGVYAGVFADYPKHTTSADALFIGTENLGNRTAGQQFQCLGAGIRAFNKANLMSGIGATTLWTAALPGFGQTGPGFLFPAETRTPITDQTLPTIFVGMESSAYDGFCNPPTYEPTPATGLRIYAGNAAGLLPYVGVVDFPTPMTFSQCLPSWADPNCVMTPGVRQPPPAIPAAIDALSGQFISTGVVYNGRLYTALTHNISATQLVIRWFEIDVAPVALGQQPTLLQWGDLNAGPDLDTFFPHIDVTDDGTMGIAFYTSGPSQHVIAQYTVRLASDAPNTVRTPFHTAVPNNYTFYNGGTSRSRYGDYIGLQVDPVDRQTFYGFTQRPDPLGFFNPPGQSGPCLNTSLCVAGDWTTDLFTFRATNNTCAADGIVTEPRVLPSTSPVVTPSTAADVDMAVFVESSEETEGCIDDEERGEICFS